MKKRIIIVAFTVLVLLSSIFVQSCTTNKATAKTAPKTTSLTTAQQILQNTNEIKSTLANLSGANVDTQIAIKKIQAQIDIINAKLGIK